MTKKIDYSVIFLAVAALFIVRSFAQKKNLNPEQEDPALSKRYNIHLIPDGKNNYRSGQIPKDKLADFIRKYGIKKIVRLNGDGLDSQKYTSDRQFSRAEEKALCQSLGCEYVSLSSHQGYKSGKGYETSARLAYDLLKDGNTLIHCAHGADRTGAMVGAYLKRANIITDPKKLWQYTTQYNSWNSLIRQRRFFNSGYDKYAETFITIPEIKRITNQ